MDTNLRPAGRTDEDPSVRFITADAVVQRPLDLTAITVQCRLPMGPGLGYPHWGRCAMKRPVAS